jgi:hypothetical protein
LRVPIGRRAHVPAHNMQTLNELMIGEILPGCMAGGIE